MKISGNNLKSCRGWRQGPGYTEDHFKTFLHDIKWEDSLQIHSISREIASRTLHNLVVFVEPTAFNMWQDVKDPTYLKPHL